MEKVWTLPGRPGLKLLFSHHLQLNWSLQMKKKKSHRALRAQTDSALAWKSRNYIEYMLVRLTGWTGFLWLWVVDWGAEARTSRWHEVDRLRSSRCAFFIPLLLLLFLLLVRLADLSGAAGLWFSHGGSRRSEEEFWKASGGCCSLAGVVHPEALPGAAHTQV